MKRQIKMIAQHAKSFSKKSAIGSALSKKAGMQGKETEKLKNDSLKLSAFIGLFAWLLTGVFLGNLLLSAAISIFLAIIVFAILMQLPLAKKKAYARKVEADLPFFLIMLATELRTGKNFSKAIKDACKDEGFASKEFEKILDDMKKGAGFAEALQNMNQRVGSVNIRRVSSNLSNLNSQGARDVSSIRKIAEELLAKQRIESKEFSGKMVIYALVFIAVSAIVPAMFQSFTLIGSFFMKLNFTAQQVFLVSVVLFPVLDFAVLIMIDSKTPLFLKQ